MRGLGRNQYYTRSAIAGYKRHMNLHRWALLTLVVSAISLLTCPMKAAAGGAQSGQKAAAATEQRPRTKVAEGEYVVSEQANGGAVGPFGEEVYNFHETWVLWRDGDGRYEVEGERRFESPRGTARSDRFAAELSRDLTITRVTEFSRLKWRSDSGPLTCEFLRSELHCSSNAKNREQAIELRLPMQKPFGLLWPISAFSLSGLTREAERDARHATQIQLVSIEQPSADIPVLPMILDGELRYLGEENIEIAGVPRRAFKFSIKAALSPEFAVWTTTNGLLLAVSVEHGDKNWPEQGMKLLHFQEWPASQ
jgi:hypothetical protein